MHAAVIRRVISCQINPKTTSFQKQGTMISQFLHKGERLKGIVEKTRKTGNNYHKAEHVEGHKHQETVLGPPALPSPEKERSTAFPN
jgi:hypothetical protein